MRLKGKLINKKFLIALAIIFLIAAGMRSAFKIYPGIKPTISDFEEQNFIEKIEGGMINTISGFTIPKGFEFSIYAKDLGPARDMTFDNKGRLIVSITKENKIIRIEGGRATPVLIGLNKPHGIAIFKKWLYVAETDKVSRYPYDHQTGDIGAEENIMVLPSGGRHFTRTIRFGPDEKLYVSIGSSCDVCIENDERNASIMRLDPDGRNEMIYAEGLRNAVFFDWEKETGVLYATEMGRDHLGDDLPPDEINSIDPGEHYGWPFCYGKKIYDKSYGGVNNCKHTKASYVDLGAHVAPLGIAFLPDSWGDELAGDMVVAYHGSWNRSIPVGYSVVRFDKEGMFQNENQFIHGWLTEEFSSRGRPVAFTFDKNDNLYISDDKAGVIYLLKKETPGEKSL